MTTITAFITNEEVSYISGDTLITRKSQEGINSYINYHKKIIKNTCLLTKKDNSSYTYNLVFGIAGSVTMGESIKSRAEMEISSKKVLKLEKIIERYQIIYNDIINDVLLNYYGAFKNYDDHVLDLDTHILILGFCPLEKRQEIYEIKLNLNTFLFETKKYIKKNSIVTIGCKVEEINNKLEKPI
jgi:hypothetical protein